MTNARRHNFDGLRTLVVGLGRSGLAAARFLVSQGAVVTVNDQRDAAALGAALEASPQAVTRVLGGHPEAVFTGAQLIVLSPGVPELPSLAAARAAGVPVTGEIELAGAELAGTLIGITGTNGKSTTTSWLGEMIAPGTRPLFVGGNLGEPLMDAVSTAAAGPDGVCVVELSSFQLETARRLRPRVALLLNLSEDHLDRYADIADYQAAKARIFSAQTDQDWAVVNADHPACIELAGRGQARLAGFSTQTPQDVGAWIDGPEIVISLPGRETLRFDTSAIGLVGRHNLENALAAALAAALVNVPSADIGAALASFGGLPHRMEAVGEVAGVRYFNDSKATNVSAVLGSLSGFPGRFVLVAGGRHKGSPYAPLRALVETHCRGLVLIGEAALLLQHELGDLVPVYRADTLEEAVLRAAELAVAGESVVLSPACSSYDMFTNFEQRGLAFAAAVRRLGGEP